MLKFKVIKAFSVPPPVPKPGLTTIFFNEGQVISCEVVKPGYVTSSSGQNAMPQQAKLIEIESGANLLNYQNNLQALNLGDTTPVEPPINTGSASGWPPPYPAQAQQNNTLLKWALIVAVIYIVWNHYK